MKIKITVIILLVLLGGYLFIRALPTYFIHKPTHSTYMAAIKLQEFAEKHNVLFFPKLYKYEVEKYIADSVPKVEKELDKILLEAQEYYNNYQKNPNKEKLKEEFLNKIYNYEIALEGPEFWLYVELSKIQDKYLLIPIGGLPTDWIGPYYDILFTYFEKYNVDYSKLISLGKYYNNKHKELQELIILIMKGVSL